MAISFHYLTCLSSIFSISFHNFLLSFAYLIAIRLAFLPSFPYHFTIQLTFLPYFPYHFTFQLGFLPFFLYHFTFHLGFLPYFSYLSLFSSVFSKFSISFHIRTYFYFHIFELSAPSPPFYFHYPCPITLFFSTNEPFYWLSAPSPPFIFIITLFISKICHHFIFPYFPNHFNIQLTFLPYFPFLLTIPLRFLP